MCAPMTSGSRPDRPTLRERYFNELLLNEGCSSIPSRPFAPFWHWTSWAGMALRCCTASRKPIMGGNWVGSPARLTALAQEQGVQPEAFAQACQRVDLAGHLADSQAWLRRLGGQGFPTLGLMRGERLLPVPVSPYLGSRTPSRSISPP